MELGDCIPLHARISAEQCKRNSKGYKAGGTEVPPHVSCQGCKGLVNLGPVAPEMVKEDTTVKKTLKHIYCSAKGCYRIVKKEGEFCKVHQGLQDQVAAGVTEGDKEPVSETAAETHELDGITADSYEPVETETAKEPLRITYENENEKAALAGAAICFDCADTPDTCGRPTPVDGLCAGFEPSVTEEMQNVAVTGLQALLRMPPPPPPSPEGLLIPITQEETKELITHGVTTEDLAQLVRMLLAGELCQLKAASHG